MTTGISPRKSGDDFSLPGLLLKIRALRLKKVFRLVVVISTSGELEIKADGPDPSPLGVGVSIGGSKEKSDQKSQSKLGRR